MSTKSGTGAGALLVISATTATSASPAPAPTSTRLTVAPTSSPTGIAVMQIKDFTMPQQKWSYDDVTNTGSPLVATGSVGVIHEFLPTLVDPGEFNCTGIFLPSDPGLNAIQGCFNSGIAQGFQVQLQPLGGQTANGNVYSFNAYVQENPIPSSITVDKAITIKINLKLNTAIVIGAGN